MMVRLTACLVILASSHRLCGQDIRGIVISRSGDPVQGATIMLKKADSSRVPHYALSDAKGNFRIVPHSPDPGIMILRHISFLPRTILLDTVPQRSDMVIIMEAGKQELQEVVVKASMPVLVRNDTVIYRADAFAGPGVRNVEDLLSRMQGFMVSPDGRITYNGRPVEKVMVDGDDLAGKGYQLLTRNLSAGYIDKVEVVTDFSSNRLLGQLRRQDGVGVNLRIRERYRDRVSGGAEAAFSGIRYRGNLNAISLAAQRKWFAFGEVNNTADDALGSLGNLPEGEGFPEGSTQGIISPGRVPVPPLAERYTRNNRDAAGAVMAAWKSGSHNRLRMLIGHADQRILNEGSAFASTRIGDSLAWQVMNGNGGAPTYCVDAMRTLIPGRALREARLRGVASATVSRH